MTRRQGWLTAVALALTAAVATPASANEITRPGTKPMWAALGIGGAINLDGLVTQFKITQDFGYHFEGGGDGPAIGAMITESVGSDLFVLTIGPKGWWDFRLLSNLGLYLSPSISLGYGYATSTRTGGGDASFFDINLGLAVKLILNDFGMVFVRPLSFDILIGETTVARYDLIFGGGITF